MKKIILLLVLIVNLFGFDYKLEEDRSPWIAAHYELPKYMIAVAGLSALVEGSDTRFGKTSWQSLEAGIMSQIVTEVMKLSFGRVRPTGTDSPNKWFSGGKSFPSGHVSGTTALITPYILEYQKEYPAMHLLWLVSAYEMYGRLKYQAHWQSDVLVGALVGFASGYWAHSREYPVLLSFHKDHVFVGLRYRF